MLCRAIGSIVDDGVQYSVHDGWLCWYRCAIRSILGVCTSHRLYSNSHGRAISFSSRSSSSLVPFLLYDILLFITYYSHYYCYHYYRLYNCKYYYCFCLQRRYESLSYGQNHRNGRCSRMEGLSNSCRLLGSLNQQLRL